MVGVQSGRGFRELGTLFARGAIGQKTDAELLELFARGEDAEDAFEALVVRHGPAVLRACRRVLADPNDAEDAFQATFLILARRAGSNAIGRPESLGPWLHGVALRVARKARVAAARRRRHEGRVASRIVFDHGYREDLASVLREEIDGLPEALKAPVVFCYLEGMTYQGAARLLRVSEGTIRGRLARARELLRLRLSRQEEAVPTGRRDVLASRPAVSGVSTRLDRRDDPRRDDAHPGRGGFRGHLGVRCRADGRSPDDDARDPMDVRCVGRRGDRARRGRRRRPGRNGP